jgi:diguanylate cyclase (GGDEF)-like protein
LQQNIDIVVCSDARQALTVVFEQQPQALVVDTVASQIEATDLIEMIRQDETFFGLPIVALIEGRTLDAPLIYLTTTADDCSIKWKDQDVLMSSLVTRARRYRRAWAHSRRDLLTGLLNRSAFLETFDLELVRINRGRSYGCLALIDVDDFKSINDTHGHAAGDAVLRKLSSVLVSRLRRVDLVARYAGDEIVIYLPDTLVTEADQLMNEIRTVVTTTDVQVQGGDVHFTISCGLQELRALEGQAFTADQVIAAADRLLYRAKHLGRNRVCVSE